MRDPEPLSNPLEFSPKVYHSSVEATRAKIFDNRIKNRNEKAAIHAKEVEARLNEYLDAYFSGFSDDNEENELAYNTFNREWKAYCFRVNTSQKLIVLRHESFERESALIIENNPQFQPKKEN